MNIQYFSQYSIALQKTMEFKLYGKEGKLCIVFPSLAGTFYEFEDHGMIEAMKEYINKGSICLICIQSHDNDSWCLNADEDTRIQHHEQWIHYICNELIPFIQNYLNNAQKMMTMGVSMGAFHAFNLALRRNDLFDTVLGMSGMYHAATFLPNYQNEAIYYNSPLDYLSHLTADHPFTQQIRKLKIVLCVGQGAFEEVCLQDTKAVEKILKQLNVDCFIDYWGYDVNHDWYWWQKQLPYLLERCI